jgi:hypothetical protein
VLHGGPTAKVSPVPLNAGDAWAQRQQWITSRLREHLGQAVTQAKLTPAQAADVLKNGSASRHWGTQIDTTFKNLVQNDMLLNGEVAISPRSLPRGAVAPDVIDLRSKQWWDATTVDSWGMHNDKYSTQFGTGTGLLYDKK